MSGMLWLGGPKANVLESSGGVTASPSADSLFPTTALYDRHPGRIFKFGSLTAAPTLTTDIDMVQGHGGFELGDLTLDGWTAAVSGAGVTGLTITQQRTGNYGVELDASAGGIASVYRDIVVRSGSLLKLTVWLKTDGVGIARGRIRNQQTGNYWDGASWTAAATPWASSGTAVYDDEITTIPTEDLATCGGPLTTLRVEIYNADPGKVWADDISLIPGVSFASVHGHNIDGRSAPVLRASTDNFVASDVLISTPTLVQPSFYSTFTRAYYRYWRIAFVDTNSAAIYLGEWVLGDPESFRGPALPLQANYSAQQVRVPHRFGAPAVYAMGTSELTAVPMTVRCESYADRLAFMQEWKRTLGGYPVVVVPHDGDSHTDVIYGLMSDALPHSWATKRFVTLSTEIEPLPLPLITG